MKTELKNTTPTANEPVKIYRINDCDWYVARTLEEAVAQAVKDYDGDQDYIDEPRELTDEEMNTFQFWDADDTHVGSLEHWECPCGYTATYATRENRWTGERWEHRHDETEPAVFVPMKNVSRVSFVEELGKHLAEGRPIPGIFASTES